MISLKKISMTPLDDKKGAQIVDFKGSIFLFNVIYMFKDIWL
jgi:hypothetical protein